jgi:hypothetical protein
LTKLKTLRLFRKRLPKNSDVPKCGSAIKAHRISDRVCDECIVYGVRDTLMDHGYVYPPEYKISEDAWKKYVS